MSGQDQHQGSASSGYGSVANGGGVDSEPVLLDHEYDGIREYDNPTPGWWHLIFLGTIVFSVFYFFITTFSPLYRDIHGQHARAEERALERMFAEIGQLDADTATFVRLMGDEDLMRVGASLYRSHCVSCHAADGGGLVGPNLADNRWIHVRRIDDIYKVIAEGAAQGAMPAWGRRLHQNEMVLLTSFVAQMLGKPVERPRNPEGNITIESWTDGTVERSASVFSPSVQVEQTLSGEVMPGGA